MERFLVTVRTAAERTNELFARFSCKAFQAVVVAAPRRGHHRAAGLCIRRGWSLDRELVSRSQSDLCYTTLDQRWTIKRGCDEGDGAAPYGAPVR